MAKFYYIFKSTSVIDQESEVLFSADFFGSSKSDPKSIAMCPEVKSSHFGIIETPEPPTDIKKTKKNQTIAAFSQISQQLILIFTILFYYL